jgi:leucyl/phenylalanyl-tRNA---protein transferase
MTSTVLPADPWAGLQLPPGGGVPVAIGGELTPDRVLAACYYGVFCTPRSDPAEIALQEQMYGPDVRSGGVLSLPGGGNPYATLWWQPRERYVIPVAGVRIGRSMRRTLRVSQLSTTTDTAFDAVMAGCVGERTPRWLTEELIEVTRRLHQQGWARTVEVWERGELVAGLFGFPLEGVFVMASAFHRKADCAKVAIADLGRRVAGGSITLLDTEVRTEYTARMGAAAMPVDEYVCRVGRPGVPGFVAAGTRQAGYLLEPS